MLGTSRFYTLLLILFIITLLLYFVHLVYPNRKVNQAAFWLLAIVWGLHFLYLLYKGWSPGGGLFTSPSDSLFFYAWLIVSISLLAHRFLNSELILFLANIVGFVFLAISVMTAGRDFSPSLASQLESEWILIHIILAFFSYAAFTLSFIMSFLYMLEHFLLKKKMIKKLYQWPRLDRLDSAAYLLNVLGFPLFVISLLLGIIRAEEVLQFKVWLDVKVWFSAVVIGGYALYFYLRLVQGRKGKGLAQLNIACFLLLLANYFLSVQFTHFHT